MNRFRVTFTLFVTDKFWPYLLSKETNKPLICRKNIQLFTFCQWAVSLTIYLRGAKKIQLHLTTEIWDCKVKRPRDLFYDAMKLILISNTDNKFCYRCILDKRFCIFGYTKLIISVIRLEKSSQYITSFKAKYKGLI